MISAKKINKITFNSSIGYVMATSFICIFTSSRNASPICFAELLHWLASQKTDVHHTGLVDGKEPEKGPGRDTRDEVCHLIVDVLRS